MWASTCRSWSATRPTGASSPSRSAGWWSRPLASCPSTGGWSAITAPAGQFCVARVLGDDRRDGPAADRHVHAIMAARMTTAPDPAGTCWTRSTRGSRHSPATPSQAQALIDELAARLREVRQEISDLQVTRKTLISLADADDGQPAAEPAGPAPALPDHPAYQQILTPSPTSAARSVADLWRRVDSLRDRGSQEHRELALPGLMPSAPTSPRRLNNHSGRLSELGRPEEALVAIEEAVSIYRELAAARPDAFRPVLGMSLNNQTPAAGGTGAAEEALVAIEESVAIRRELAAVRPDAFRPDLAMSLANLSLRLGDLGRPEEALVAIEEAIAIRRELAAASPDAFQPVLAMSLTNYSMRLGNVGGEALTAVQDALVIYRDLAGACPNVFLPRLAWALDSLAARLTALGRGTEAVQATEEAVTIRSQT